MRRPKTEAMQLEIGDRVRIVEGVFSGYGGVIVARRDVIAETDRDSTRFLVEVQLLTKPVGC